MDVECWLLYSLYVDFIQVRLGSRAGELRGLELGARLVSSYLVSSRLVSFDEVDSGEYQVMGLLRRNFIFSFCDSTYLPIRAERGGSGDL